MKKYLLLLIVLFSLQYLVRGQSATAPSGDGTAGSPYQIATWQNLYWVSQNSDAWDKHFSQTDDITFPTDIRSWDGGKGWTPIGGSPNFSGTYNGNSKTISGLFIQRDDENDVALFGRTWDARLLNVHIVDAELSGKNGVSTLVSANTRTIVQNCSGSGSVLALDGYASGLVAYSSIGEVSHSYFSGAVQSAAGNAGGLIGLTSEDCSVADCYTNADVEATDNAGGLIAVAGGTIERCYSMGSVSSSGDNSSVGGLVASLSALLKDCYSTASVSGSWNIGGLVGWSEFNGSVTNCYSMGAVATSSRGGGLVGQKVGSSGIEASFWDTETSGYTTSTGGEGKTSLEMKAQTTFTQADWDFDEVWMLDASINDGYPSLIVREAVEDAIPIPEQPAGDGTQSSPYLIASLANLYWIADENVNKGKNFSGVYLEQTANIDASATSQWFNGQGWLPIGTNSLRFLGKYDGKGYEISNLHVNRDADQVGLFGSIEDGASLSNITLTDVSITGEYYTGGIAGSCYNLNTYNSSISNCSVTGTIIGTNYTGGAVGRIFNSTVTNCSAEVTLTGNERVGGFAGEADQNSVVEECQSNSSVTGIEYVGGFCGVNTRESVVRFCSTTGSVNAKNNAGGFAGMVNSGSEVSNCYSRSTLVKGVGNYADTFGGFAGTCGGTAMNMIQISRCYSTGSITFEGLDNPTDRGFAGFSNEYAEYLYNHFDSQTSGQTTDGAGTATANTTAQMKEESTYEGWNFTGVWQLVSGANDGYPTVRPNPSGGDEPSGDNPVAIIPEGIGSANSPFIIERWENLYWLSQNAEYWFDEVYVTSYYFTQTADIDFADATPAIETWAGGKGWRPIGDESLPFRGSYDGNGHSIKNLYINRPTQDYVGLFGAASNATIKDIVLIDVDIAGKDNVGGFIGSYEASDLDEGKLISGCSTSGSVTGGSNVGGFVGQNTSTGIISRCYSSASVMGYSPGGFVGSNGEHVPGQSTPYSGRIENCYSLGTVSSDDGSAGGFVFHNGYNTIQNCYSVGIVNGSSDGGGLVAWAYEPDLIVDSYWDVTASGQADSDAGEGKTTPEMKQQSTFTNWNFDAVWQMDENTNNGYPSFISYAPQGDGTEANPYLIATWQNLYWVGQSPQHWGKHLKQVANIEFPAEIETWDDGKGWLPIGTYSSPFSGSYNGNNHTISNLYCNRPQTDYIGLFGNVSGTGIVVRNLGMLSADITGGTFVGALAGATDNTDIQNCYSTGSVSGGNMVGGIVGQSFSTNFTSCYSEAEVSSGVRIGGIVGSASGCIISHCHSVGIMNGEHLTGGLAGEINIATIKHSYSSATVNGSSDYGSIGGLVGWNWGAGTIIELSYSTGEVNAPSNEDVGGLVGTNSGIVRNCYSTGNVTGSENVGGLVGYNYDDATVLNSYSTGRVEGTIGVGGLVGEKESGTVTSSYWDTETSGMATSDGGEGLATQQMKSDSAYLASGWDFTLVWTIEATENNGYPHFREAEPIATLATVSTQAITDITQTSANTGGDVTTDGGANVTARGVVWGTSQNPTLASNAEQIDEGTGTGSFSCSLTGLTAGTTYYVRAYATNSEGTAYGNEISFTTNNENSETGVNPLSETLLRAYPNPFSDVIHINAGENATNIILINTMGQKVKEQPFDNNTNLNTRQLEKGLYILIVQYLNGEKQVLKMYKK